MKENWVVQGCFDYVDKDGIAHRRRLLMIHRRPDWMPLKLHIVLEEVLADVRDVLDPAMNAGAYQVYHLLGGLICGFSMEDILRFIRKDLRVRRMLRESGRSARIVGECCRPWSKVEKIPGAGARLAELKWYLDPPCDVLPDIQVPAVSIGPLALPTVEWRASPLKFARALGMYSSLVHVLKLKKKGF